MKYIILVFFLLISTLTFSQSKKDILTQKWILNKVEEFGQKYSPMETQKNDWVQFYSNGAFKGIIESKHVEGTWSVHGTNIIVSVNKKLSKTKINWTKVKSVDKSNFSLEYQNGDLITTTLLFIPEN